MHQSIHAYLRHQRPGLVMISVLRARSDQLLNLSRNFALTNHAGMKKFIDTRKNVRKTLEFICQLGIICSELGLSFVVECPWPSESWQSRCLKKLEKLASAVRVGGDQDLHRLHDSAQGDLEGIVTNHLGIAQTIDSKGQARRGTDWTSQRNEIYKAYAKTVYRDPKKLNYVNYKDIAAEDQRHDEAYFTSAELQEIFSNTLENPKKTSEILSNTMENLKNPSEIQNNNMENLKNPLEILHEEEADMDLNRKIFPEAVGVTEEQLDHEGWQELDDHRWLHVAKDSGNVAVPDANHPASSLPWRSAWIMKEPGSWILHEDEIRWQDLRDQQRRLPLQSKVVTLFQAKVSEGSLRKMRNFPGMREITLEKMVRRAQEGLGHPDNNRLVRILRQSQAPEEAIQIAKDLKCSVCASYRLPDAPRRSAPPREAMTVNDLVGIDTVHLRDFNNKAIPAINVVDWNTHFQLVVPLPAETAEEVRKAYRQWTRFFGPPRRLMVDLGTEYQAAFRRQAERDGTEVVPSALEAPYQRGLTERAGGVFKNILYKAMLDYDCQTEEEWKDLVDVSCMTRNRRLLRGGYSPIQRVVGYSPRLPGGLLSGGESDHMVSDLVRLGDAQAEKAMRMRKAAAIAFHAADCDQALRASIHSGPRPHRNYETGQAVFFWRRGAGSTKKTRMSYWQGPARVMMTDLPGCLWLSFQNTVVKVAPERVRPASEEEQLSLSGWMSGISQVREAFEKAPKRGYIDLTKEEDTPVFSGEEAEDVDPRRDEVDNIAGSGERPAPQPMDVEHIPAEAEVEDGSGELREGESPPGPEQEDQPAGDPELKRELEEAPEPPGKRSRVELLEAYNLQLQALVRQRQRKEATAKEFVGPDAARLQRAIQKEINNNLTTGAYKILSLKESEEILRNKREKVMESRYVLTKKPLEPSDVPAARAEDTLLEDDGGGPHKAKCRHVMKGFSEEAATEVESTTPQVSRDSVIFVTQVLASMRWNPGFLDFTQAFHSGGKPGEGSLEGIIGVATDDLLHGGGQRHWQVINRIAEEYKLGKNQSGQGRFTGKDIKLQDDGSITIDQAFYVADKVKVIKLARARRQQRYSRCNPSEVEQLRSQLGALAWLTKETRCDLSGRVALLQQAFPEPRIADILEGNKIAEEAHRYAQVGIKVMPIPWHRLRVSVVTDAAWGNAKDGVWIEDDPDDWWEEQETSWVRHHVAPRRTAFHPGAAPGGPDLHGISGARKIQLFAGSDTGIIKDEIDDNWFDSNAIRVLREEPWTGQTTFQKASKEHLAVPATKIHSSLVQLQNLACQAGQIIIYHDKALAQSNAPAATTVAAWKSFKLKRKVVDTLAAEGQALQSGIGAVHWHRLLFLEAFHGMMSAEDWRREAQKLPFLAAVDSKSLYDAANKLSSTTAYISDKRTAIDLAVIKNDVQQTAGTIRWIDTRAMIADQLTKNHPGHYLRHVLTTGSWSIVEEGTALQRKALERKECYQMFFLVVGNRGHHRLAAMATSELDSEVEFKRGALQLGVTASNIDSLVASGFKTFGQFAFSVPYQPGSADESPLVELLTSSLSGEPEAGQLSCLRRLFWESHGLAVRDLRLRQRVRTVRA
ncbi:hypothetical protein AK812_SmicGene16199 [Symbiodinium microadriaticum]|uniref:Integrase catalytic domain-containing protein n=1 Tax=Symbiodinium microadriaticum TaxID=2951 RepID=A0A1Q9E0W5_SYMMI|nr:hypothetical protein AK812_SmicGene16199 [Symbiodinium microadriaticum]